MKGFITLPALASILLLIFIPNAFADQGLPGHWSCTHNNNRHSLEFISANQLRFDGAVSNYMMMFGSMLVEEDGEVVAYALNQQKDDLVITNPDGSITRCKRGRAEPITPSITQPYSPAQAQSQQPGQQPWPRYAKPPTPPGGYTGNETGIEYLVYKFAGRWDYYSGNRLINRYFKPDGSYEDSYEAGFSGELQDQYGFQSGNWSAVGKERGSGSWYPVGTLHQGKIFITKGNGSQEVLDYRILYKNGQYYTADYYFNGDLYSVKYIYR
jgi:hypothetical protein